MADDNTFRSYRTNDLHRRSAGPADAGAAPRGSDPLAELARLIGQTDPFAEFAQSKARGAEQGAAVAPPIAPDWRRNAMPGYDTARGQPAAAGSRSPSANSGYQRRDPYQMAKGGELPPEPEFDDAQAYRHDAPPLAGVDHSDTHHDDPRYAGAPDARENEAYLDDGAAMGPHDDEMYDDAPRSRWRGGALTAITLIVCATLGSAGAYAYRSYSTRAPSIPTPPVITAEQTPTKVVPAADPQSSKAIQDRVRDQGPNERVVSREEQPVEPRNLTAVAPSRPGLPAPGAPSQALASAPALSPTGSTPAVGEPKRVRTVTYGPDGTEIGSRPVGSLGPSGALPRAAAPAAAARNGGPISLDPQAPASAPPPAARERAATAVPPPTRLDSAPPDGTVTAGGYVVQISSQKTDTEAQASIRSLQAKYPHLLNGQQPTVRRADLGAKGVFYRAVVGPFASSGEANSLCSGLKAAGGQCIVQKN
jgi:hypothetical protein